VVDSDAQRIKRLSDLRRAGPGDATLQNLLSTATTKLELCSRLPVFEYEAHQDGAHGAAYFFGELLEREAKSVEPVLACLRQYLDGLGLETTP
jgi:hypothetical protein